jgi:signal transduction histidine kinase
MDENGNFEVMLSMVQDITEQLKLETHVRQTQRLDTLGTLAGGIAHDFNNILTTIGGYTEMALSVQHQGLKREDYIKKIQNSVLRAQKLVKQILTFSRGVEPKVSPVNLPEIINQVHQLLHHMQANNIQINISHNSQEVVKADETQLTQVLMNLCTNAIKAMREKGGTLTITTEDFLNENPQTFDFSELFPGKYVKLSISDTGPGIPPAIYNRIFEPFFTTYKVGDGTGLGLAVVYGIIKKHNAAINVINKPGEGVTFEVYLPATSR